MQDGDCIAYVRHTMKAESARKVHLNRDVSGTVMILIDKGYSKTNRITTAIDIAVRRSHIQSMGMDRYTASQPRFGLDRVQ